MVSALAELTVSWMVYSLANLMAALKVHLKDYMLVSPKGPLKVIHSVQLLALQMDQSKGRRKGAQTE